jgi:hypothetical protein
MPLKRIDAMLPKGMPVQGNLDPMRLVAGGPGLAGRAWVVEVWWARRAPLGRRAGRCVDR